MDHAAADLGHALLRELDGHQRERGCPRGLRRRRACPTYWQVADNQSSADNVTTPLHHLYAPPSAG